jgi:hypothetical protein
VHPSFRLVNLIPGCIKVANNGGSISNRRLNVGNRLNGGKVKRTLTAGVSALALVAGLLTFGLTPANAETIRLPKTNMAACSVLNGIYCVEAVTLTTGSGQKIPLIYVPAGQAVPAEKPPTDFFAPIARIKGGKVVDNNWWTSQYQRDIFTSPKFEMRNLSPLVGTANFPEQGAIYDPATKLYDINKPLDSYSHPVMCWDKATQTSVETTFGECYKGAVGFIVDNEVKFYWIHSTAAEALSTINEWASYTYVDLAELSALQLRPVINTTYDATTKKFGATEALVIPIWISQNAMINGWAVAGSVAAAPQADITAPSTTTTPTTETATAEAKELAATAPGAPEPGIAVSTPAETGRALTGRWTHARWHELNLGALGYDGVSVEARAANEFVTSILFTDVLPTLTDKDKKVNLAGQVGNKNYAIGLDPDLVISVKVRVGNMKTGVTVAVGTDITVDQQSFGDYNAITITGSPVTVPLAAKVADCSGETGIAKANVRQFQMIAYAQNDDRTGFGVEGTSGDMSIGSNGVCNLSTPVWNNETKEFTWSAAAPHFAPDGVTVNRGFYKAIIPVNDAKLLWGLENPNDAATALQITLTTEAGGTAAASKSVSVKNGKIIIDVSGFEYSRPKLKIGIKAGYKPSKTMLNKSSITCVKGKSVKKITAVNPTCPAGYKKK